MAENLKSYEQACSSIRHYSTLSSNVRIITVIQGIVVLGAWVSVHKGERNDLEILLPIFGVILTIFLAFFHYGYFSAADFFYKLASRMEEALFEEGYRTMQEYLAERSLKYRRFHLKLFIFFGPFTLLIILFLVALIISLI